MQEMNTMRENTQAVPDLRYGDRTAQDQAKRKAFAANPAAAVAEPRSAVEEALASLVSEINECHFQADTLISSISTAMSADSGVSADLPARPVMASELAERIQSAADSLRVLRDKLVDSRYRVTL